MSLKVITSTDNVDKCHQLERSLKHFNHDYHIINKPWGGFLDKIHLTYHYLKTLEGYTHFLYTDAWDTFCLSDKIPEVEGLVISGERACYPHPDKEKLYPTHPSPWHFVNGGGWTGEISAFLKMYEKRKPYQELNDQVYLTDIFIEGHLTEGIRLDYNCEIFQTIAFCPMSDFEVKDQRIRNTVTNTYPVFIHGNGKTPMDWIYEII